METEMHRETKGSAPVSFELFSGFRSRDPHLPDGVGRLDAAGRGELVAQAGVRHAAHHDLSVAYAVLAAREAAVQGEEPLGLLVNNGPWNLFGSMDLDQRAREAGARFINPLRFPATLTSHVPTKVAAELHITGFAYAAGYDGAAFLDGIRLGARLMAAGHARTVLVVAVCHGDALLSRIATHARMPAPLLDVALCARLGSPTGRGVPLTLAWEAQGKAARAGAHQARAASGAALTAAAAVDLAIDAQGLAGSPSAQGPRLLPAWGARLAP